MLICQGDVGVVSSPGGESYPSIHLALEVPPALSVPQAEAFPVVEPWTFQLPMTIQTWLYYLMFQILEKMFVIFLGHSSDMQSFSETKRLALVQVKVWL